MASDLSFHRRHYLYKEPVSGNHRPCRSADGYPRRGLSGDEGASEKLVYANVYSQEDYQIRGDMLAYYIPARGHGHVLYDRNGHVYGGSRRSICWGRTAPIRFTTGHFTEGYTVSDLDKVNLARARRTLNNPALTLEELGEYRRMRSIMAYESWQSMPASTA